MMKTIIAFFTLSITFTSCCYVSQTKVSGNGNVITEERAVASFTKLDISGAYKVILEEGEKESLKIETDENLLKYISTDVEDGVLRISNGSKNLDYTKLRIYLVVKNITHIKARGAVTIKSEKVIRSDSMEMKGSGAIKIDMQLDVPSLTVKMSGASTITLKGRSDSASVKASGASTYKAEDFQVNKYKISMSGAGTANILVVDEMSVRMSGAGTLKYKGDPQKTHINISGAGSVSKL